MAAGPRLLTLVLAAAATVWLDDDRRRPRSSAPSSLSCPSSSSSSLSSRTSRLERLKRRIESLGEALQVAAGHARRMDGAGRRLEEAVGQAHAAACEAEAPPEDGIRGGGGGGGDDGADGSRRQPGRTYQIQGIKKGQETGRWYDLQWCKRNEDGTYRVRVKDTEEARWARMAGKKASRVRPTLIRVKPSILKKPKSLNDNSNSNSNSNSNGNGKKSGGKRAGGQGLGDGRPPVYQMLVHQAGEPTQWVDLSAAEYDREADAYSCTVEDTLLARFLCVFTNVTISPVKAKDVRVRPENYRTELPEDFLKFEAAEVAEQARLKQLGINPDDIGQMIESGFYLIPEHVKEKLKAKAAAEEDGGGDEDEAQLNERRMLLESLGPVGAELALDESRGQAPQRARGGNGTAAAAADAAAVPASGTLFTKYQVAGFKHGKPTGVWYDLAKCIRGVDGTYTITVASTPATRKAKIAGKVHEKVPSKYVRSRSTELAKRAMELEKRQAKRKDDGDDEDEDEDEGEGEGEAKELRSGDDSDDSSGGSDESARCPSSDIDPILERQSQPEAGRRKGEDPEGDSDGENKVGGGDHDDDEKDDEDDEDDDEEEEEYAPSPSPESEDESSGGKNEWSILHMWPSSTRPASSATPAL